MQAASREALASARDRLDALAGDLDGAAVDRLADELTSMARLLVREIVLRRALSDPSRPAPARVALADDLIGDKVSDPTQQVLDGLVEGRWSASTDLVDGTELLAVQAVLISAERDDRIADVEDELFRFARIVGANPELAGTLGDLTAGTARRTELADSLLAGKATPQTQRLVDLAIGGFGGRRDVQSALERLVDVVARRRQRSVAVVRSAGPLTEEQEQRLAGSLGRIYGRDMDLQVEIDESLLGGLSVRVGDDVYDGSVARRLAQARTALTR